VPLPGTLPRFLGYEHFAYTPYGESWVSEDLNQQSTTMTHRFTGQELDAETGLYAFPARYYDPLATAFPLRYNMDTME
jgi:RHS repeat-associated protein